MWVKILLDHWSIKFESYMHSPVQLLWFSRPKEWANKKEFFYRPLFWFQFTCCTYCYCFQFCKSNWHKKRLNNVCNKVWVQNYCHSFWMRLVYLHILNLKCCKNQNWIFVMTFNLIHIKMNSQIRMKCSTHPLQWSEVLQAICERLKRHQAYRN